jgi:hypothetical protein
MNSQVPSDFNPNRFLGSLFDVAKAVLITPKVFFSTMARQGPLTHPVLFLITSVVVHTLLAHPFHQMPGLVYQNLFMGITLPFLTAGIVFLLLTRLFNSSGTYEATFRVNAYAAAVGLVSWIPVIGLFLELYRLYIIVVGLRSIYAIKTTRAIIAIFLTFIIYTVLFRMLFNATGGQFMNLPG